MLERLKHLLQGILNALGKAGSEAASATRNGARRGLDGLAAIRGLLALAMVLGAAGYLLYRNPPFKTVERGELGVRANRLTGELTEWREGSVVVLPLLHETRIFALRDRSLPAGADFERRRPVAAAIARGTLARRRSHGALRARRRARCARCGTRCPTTSAPTSCEPAVQGVIYKVFARYTVREIFSTKRVEIQQAIEIGARGRASPPTAWCCAAW